MQQEILRNSLLHKKGTDVPKMCTRAKMQTVASGRARRGNVPRHIHFIEMRKQLQVHPLKNMMFL